MCRLVGRETDAVVVVNPRDWVSLINNRRGAKWVACYLPLPGVVVLEFEY